MADRLEAFEATPMKRPACLSLMGRVVGAVGLLAGGIAGSYCLCWTEGQRPEITVDLQQPQRCGAFRVHLTGYPWWDAMKGRSRTK